MQDRTPRPGDLYRHFKGKLYQIITVAAHTETEELLVIYQALYGDYKTYAREFHMFLSEVDKEKYPRVHAIYRFEKVSREMLKDENRQDIELSKELEASVVSESSLRIESNEIESTSVETIVDAPEFLVDPDLMAFLDANSYEEKLEILYSIRKRIDPRMMTNIELSLDLSGHDGPLEDRIDLVKNNLQTLAKFECKRLR